MSGSIFYQAGPVEQAAVNLFYGLGYNFYRLENQLRADDLLVRHKVAGVLGEARKTLSRAELAYREAHLPPLSRERPRQDPEVLRSGHSLEKLVERVAGVSARIRALPVPGNDRIIERHRREARTLELLVEADASMQRLCDALEQILRDKTPEWIVGQAGDIETQIREIESAVLARQEILQV